MKKIILFIEVFATLLSVSSCNSDPKENADQNKPINITVLLDLSDRIERDNINPNQKTKDIALVNYIGSKFKDHATDGGNLQTSKDHLKVMFYPDPKISQVSIIAKNLDINLAKLNPAEKKMHLMRMDSVFKDGLEILYSKTLKDQKWVGCDIWGFFSDKKVDNFCMTDSARNILIILTDGYLYHKNNKIQENESYSYITPKTADSPNSKLIVRRKGLENLEVLVLEVNPMKPAHLNKIQTTIEEWLGAMGVEKKKVVETDMTNNIEAVIDNFLGF